MASAVNFFQPGTDAAIDANAIQRQRDLAMLLLKQSQQTPQGNMVSGHYVAPSALEGISNGIRGIGSVLLNKQSDSRERAMVGALRGRNAQESNDFLGALQGTPSRQIQPLTPNDDEGNPMPVAQAAAVPPDRNKALALALQSQNPQMQAMGGELMKRQMDAAELKDALSAAGISAPGGGAPGEGGMPMSAGAPGAAPAGLPPGVSPQALALMLSKNPQANKLGGVIQDLAKPQVLAEGGTLLERGAGGAFAPSYIAPKTEAGISIGRGPNGLSAAPVPGFAEARGAIAGAEANARQGAESANTMVTVDLPTGPKQMTRAQALQLAGGVQPTQVSPQPSMRPQALPAAQPGVTGNFQGDPSSIAASIAAIGDPQERANAQAAFEQQMRATGNGGGALQSSGPGIALQSSAAKEYDATRAKDFAKAAAEYQDKGRGANGMLRNLDALEQLYKDPNVAKGGMAENISGLKNMGASLGVETKGLGAEQAIQSITNKMALDQRSTAEGGGMPGAMSDADRNFLKAQTPGLEKTPEGRELIIANQRKLAQRQVQVAQMANEYERTNGKIDAGFDRQVAEFANKNQMFADQKQPAASPALDMKALAAQELARRQKKN